MRICQVNTQFRLGGAETVMHQLHDGLIDRGHSCRIAIANAGKTSLPRGYEVDCLYPRGLERLRYTRFAPWIERWFPHHRWADRGFQKLNRVPADLFHVHSFTGYASCASLAQLANQRPVLWTLHCYWGWQSEADMPDVSPRHRAALGLAPQFLRHPDTEETIESFAQELQCLLDAPICAVVPSAYAKREMQNVPSFRNWRIEHIPNGVDPSRFRNDRKRDHSLRQQLGLALESTVILFVNRDYKIPAKGFPMVLEALRAQQMGENVEIVLIGIHAHWAASQMNGISTRVHAVEFIADRGKLAEYFEAADIFLFASLRENFPCVTLEAMAAGCCVVATPTDGVKEQIESNVNGILATNTDGEALGDALRYALRLDFQTRLQIGVRARINVERRFSEDVMVQQYIVNYEHLLSARSSAS